MAKKKPLFTIDPIAEEAREKFIQIMDIEGENRKLQQKDLDYVVGKQFTADEMKQREDNGRPCFVVNRIQPTLRVITNQMRENMPAIEVSPASDGDYETAEVINGLIRAVEQDSNASDAYFNAGFYQTAIGVGYFRIGARFIDEGSFDQELFIKSIDNPFAVLWDPNSVEPDGKDANYCLVFQDMSPEEYKNRYGESKLADMMSQPGWLKSIDGLVDFANNTTVRVMEYWKKEYEKKKIYLVETVDILSGQPVHLETLEAKPDEEDMDIEYQMTKLEAGTGTGLVKRIVKERDTFEIKIKCYFCNGVEVLNETEWEGRYIPIIPVRGDYVYTDQKRVIMGIVRPMVDPQKVYNIQANLQIETIALAPKAPFVGYAGSIENYEDIWEQSNNANIPFLPVNPFQVDGKPAPLPQRMNSEPAIQAVAMTRAAFAEDMKAVTGVFDAQLGNMPGEESGKAILARQHQSETTNSHYSKNLERSIKHCGRILVDIIPYYYDTERMIKIIKPTGEEEMVAIGKYHDSPTLGDIGEKKHDLTVGKYDVKVSTGKSYTTKRQEALDSMMELGRAAPDKLPLFMDLIVGAMDWPMAKIIEKRLKADVDMNYPGLREATGEAGDDNIDSEVKAAQAIKKANDMQQGLEQAIQIGESLKQELTALKHENAALRQKAEVEAQKAELEYEVKLKELELQEQKAVQEAIKIKLDYEIRLKQLEAEKAKVSVSAIKAAGDLQDSMMEQAHKMHGSVEVREEPKEPDHPEDQE